MLPITLSFADLKKEGLRRLGSGYNPTITSSATAFTSVPARTKLIVLTVTTAPVAFQVGGTAVADQSTTLPVGVYAFWANKATLDTVKAISATGKFQVAYYG